MTYTYSLLNSMPNYYHWAIKADDRQLMDIGYLKELKENILPDFTSKAGVNTQDFTQNGFRLMIDIFPEHHLAVIHLLAGKDVPNPNPADWLNGHAKTWRYGAKEPFFMQCAVDFMLGRKETHNKNTIYRINDWNDVFGISDGDPKADGAHILMLSKEPFETMISHGFSVDLWHKFFSGSREILKVRRIDSLQTRYIAGFGLFQDIPQVHMHVLAFKKYFPNAFPEHYGFKVGEGGIIKGVEDSLVHHEIFDLIIKRGTIKGYEKKKIEERMKLDEQINELLSTISIFS